MVAKWHTFDEQHPDQRCGQDAAWVDQVQLIPQPAVILTQPVSQSVVGPTNVVISVATTGTPPLLYACINNLRLID